MTTYPPPRRIKGFTVQCRDGVTRTFPTWREAVDFRDAHSDLRDSQYAGHPAPIWEE